MEVKAKLKYLRISPRKVRLVVDVVRGMQVEKAQNELRFMNKKASEPVLKLLNSAVANAVNNFDLDEKNLYIKQIFVNEGQTLKRWMPRAFGRATPIRKRTSHIEVILGELVPSKKKSVKKDETKKDDIVKIEDVEDIKKNIKEDGSSGNAPIEKDKAKKGKKKGFTKKIFNRKSV